MENLENSTILYRAAAEMQAGLEARQRARWEGVRPDGTIVPTLLPRATSCPAWLRGAEAPELLVRYDTYFRTEAATTPAQIRASLALRYQINCLEQKLEDAAQHIDCLGRDKFDDHALHSLIFHRPTAEAIGTARLILPNRGYDALPIQRLLRENGLDAADYLPIATTAEVSRLAISNKFRRRACDNEPPVSPSSPQRGDGSERRGNLALLGLIQILLHQSLERRVTHWATMMEPKLLRMLASMGIDFSSLGPTIFHHGIRQPSYCYIPDMLNAMWREQPAFWNVVTDTGEFRQRPQSRAA